MTIPTIVCNVAVSHEATLRLRTNPREWQELIQEELARSLAIEMVKKYSGDIVWERSYAVHTVSHGLALFVANKEEVDEFLNSLFIKRYEKLLELHWNATHFNKDWRSVPEEKRDEWLNSLFDS